MADDTGKVYQESEHLAILADRVSTETATLTAQRDQLEKDLTEAQNKLDAADSAKVAAEQARQKAEEELTAFKTETTEREAAAARKDTRIKDIQERAPHLTDEWFADEKRVERIIARSDEDHEAYVADLIASVPPGTEPAKREVPRETAMQGKQVAGDEAKTSAARGFLMRNYEGTPTQKQEA